jgi:hypothetical protein
MRIPRGLALVLLSSMTLVGCATQPEPSEVQGRIGELPGVESVAAGWVGDDDIPFTSGQEYVRVVMADGATTEQVLAVLDELDAQLDADEVESIEVRGVAPEVRDAVQAYLADHPLELGTNVVL